MKNNPLVSVIMPAFNAEKFVADAIQSVLDQKYTNIELLIINDGSTDKSLDIIRSFDDNRVRVFDQKNRGVSAARNVGLDEMKGEFFTFHDADDLMPGNSISTRAKLMIQNPEVSFVSGARIELSEDLKTRLNAQFPVDRSNLKDRVAMLDSGVFIGICTWLCRRDGINVPKFPIGWTHCEDLAFMFDLVSNSHLRLTTKEVVQIYRRHDNSAMTNLNGLVNGYVAFYKKLKISHQNFFILSRTKAKMMKIVFLSMLKKSFRQALFQCARIMFA